MTYQDFFSKYTYDRRTDMLMQGRFGAIYKATYSRRKAEVLLRIMKLDDGSDSVSLKEETEFVEALPHCPYIVRYLHSYRFQESTGEIDCAVMPFFPLGNLVKVFEDWKLDATERRGLRDRILEAAAFLRGNEVNLPPFDPATIFVSEEDGELIPHLIDISGVLTDNPDYEAQVAEFISVPEEEPETSELPQVPVNEQQPIAEPEPVVEPEPESVVEPESVGENENEEEQPDNNGLKWKLIGGVALTWAAIIALIWAMHVKRNSESEHEEATDADKVEKVTYPADEYARQEAARLDSIEKAKADSIAAYKADSAAYMQKIEAERKLKAEEAKKKKEAEAKKAAETEETVQQQEQPETPTAPTTPVEKPSTPEPQPEAI